MTEAQVDLLLMDQPTVTYKKNKSKTKDSKSAPSAKKVKQAEKDWLNKYGNGEKPKLNINLGAFSFGAPESK